MELLHPFDGKGKHNYSTGIHMIIMHQEENGAQDQASLALAVAQYTDPCPYHPDHFLGDINIHPGCLC